MSIKKMFLWLILGGVWWEEYKVILENVAILNKINEF